MRSASRYLASSVTMLLLLSLPEQLLAADAGITANAASTIIEGCVAHAVARRHSHAIAVFDVSGHPIALLRMDGNTPGIMEFAMQKAEAVALWGFSTADMAAATKETPGFADAAHVVTVPGGVPVYSSDGRQFIGAVGVSGEAPGDDVACAQAGVEAAGFALARQAAK